jgi:hypothetical protein
LEKKHVVENETEERVHLVDFKEEGSERRRHWRITMWRKMTLKSLFGWWILKRRMGSVMRRLWRMNMCRRTMLMNLFNLWILRRWGSVRRRLWRMNMWRRTMLRRVTY